MEEEEDIDIKSAVMYYVTKLHYVMDIILLHFELQFYDRDIPNLCRRKQWDNTQRLHVSKDAELCFS